MGACPAHASLCGASSNALCAVFRRYSTAGRSTRLIASKHSPRRRYVSRSSSSRPSSSDGSTRGSSSALDSSAPPSATPVIAGDAAARGGLWTALSTVAASPLPTPLAAARHGETVAAESDETSARSTATVAVKRALSSATTSFAVARCVAPRNPPQITTSSAISINSSSDSLEAKIKISSFAARQISTPSEVSVTPMLPDSTAAGRHDLNDDLGATSSASQGSCSFLS
mmetsp:Transcript_17585/g.61851  ORF Transcript_17585/g.61851 Transcript_17585/m.61851 type:complete len:229 (-) Transcript_17585:1555-2241(-)